MVGCSALATAPLPPPLAAAAAAALPRPASMRAAALLVSWRQLYQW